MAEKIGKIIIAGAGSGKTYTMAHDIVKHLRNTKSSKKIYAITYTNSAKRNIINEVYEILKYYPSNLEISTIHSFLLNNIVFPYSSFSIDEIYSECSIANLPAEPQYRNYRIKQYKNENVIHSDVVISKSRSIFCEKKTDNKKTKSKKQIVREHFYSDLEALFIDEAQDMDKNFFDFLLQIRMDGFFTYIVGDINQAVKKVGEFEEFFEDYKGLYNVEINTLSRRCPDKHLVLSNHFIEKEYHQTSISTNEGKLFYLFESDPFFNITFSKENALKFIRQKYGSFDTRSYNLEYFEFVKPIEKYIHSIGGDIEARKYDFTQRIMELKNKDKDDKDIMQWLLKQCKSPSLDRREFASMINQISRAPIKKENSILSIEKAKGLGNESCFFVIDNTMYNRLVEMKRVNDKINNQLYVALTRSKDELIFVVPNNLEEKYDKESIQKNLQHLGINKYELE